jgi:isopentenyl diphosphate isomerase/L-lactate dehydrogenase-like FMN-dependent dehydrogenase
MTGLGELRQRDVYLAGARGRVSPVPFGAALEERARKSMSVRAFAYVAGGAGLESTVAANRAAFERLRIVPRVLRDVSERDTSVTLFGRSLRTPLLLAPVGALELVHREADLAVARAAAAEGVPMIFSNQASKSMEACAALMGDAPRWFQLYWSTSDDLVASLVRRAEAAGCEAIVATVDTTLFGWRPRDLELGYLPFIEGKGLAQYTSDPVFMQLVDRALELSGAPPLGPPSWAGLTTLFSLARAFPGSFLGNLRSPRPRAAVQLFTDIYSRPSLTWSDLAFLRGLTSLPILLKGVLHPDDARAALEHGVDGLVVSTHGGRQVDGAIGSVDALPGVVEAVGGRIPVLLDSGVRSGADVFKALALGAAAVLVGRPFVYGLAIAGEQGVREVLRNLAAEFDLTLGLAGCSSVSELGPDRLALGYQAAGSEP